MVLLVVVSFLERDRLEVLRAELGELRVRGRKVLEEEVLIGRVHLDVLAPRLVLQRREEDGWDGGCAVWEGARVRLL